MCEWMSCGDWCDVRLTCGDRSFNAHRAVLASASSFLKRVLLTRPADESPVFILLPEFDNDAMSSVLYYIYNGEVLLPNHKLKMFLDTANAMEIFVDQQYIPQTKEYEQYCFEPKNGDNTFTIENYNICKLRLFKRKTGCFINVKKAMDVDDLVCQTKESGRNLNLHDNAIQAFRWSEEKVPDLGNQTSISGYRQRQTFLRDIFIETCSQDGNVNGQMPSVLAISNEGDQTPACVLFTDANKKRPITCETVFVTSKIASEQNNPKNAVFDYFHHFRSKDVPANYESNMKPQWIHTESSHTEPKATILNEVLQSPWCSRQPTSYRPLCKKVPISLHMEKKNENSASGSNPKDNNNNSDAQSKSDIHFHNEVMSSGQGLTCPVCHEIFNRRQDYNNHMRRHSSITRYSCGECQKTFSQLRNFKYHMSVHRGTKEFAATCSVCGKHFNDRGYLSNHMKIHRNRKEYKCASCPKSFNQRVAFNMHVRIHTGLKPHVCEECGKAFSRKMLLKQHQRTHSGERPYACAHCDKRFADRSNMTLHLRLHTGVKPFSCTLCPKSFTKKHHLKSHLNFHTGAKPYSCPRCKLAFTQSSNMRTHFKKCNATN